MKLRLKEIDADTVFATILYGSMLLLILLMVGLVLVGILSTSYRANRQPCAELGYVSQKNLPSRCIAYWENQ